MQKIMLGKKQIQAGIPTHGGATNTDLSAESTVKDLRRKAVSALFAATPRKGLTLTMIMPPWQFGRFSVGSAILPSDTLGTTHFFANGSRHICASLALQTATRCDSMARATLFCCPRHLASRRLACVRRPVELCHCFVHVIGDVSLREACVAVELRQVN